MWSIVVVVVFPLLESLDEEVRIVDDFTFEQSVELVGIDAMRVLDFAVQVRGSGTDLDVSGAHVEEVPVERRAEYSWPLSVWDFSTWNGSFERT
ncbi:hypothetical protein QM646_03800 [Rhodococcus erythropolis]|nr:hypothetical protein [Rhodococcus erythropolis]